MTAMMLLVPSCFLMGQVKSASCIADHYKAIALPCGPPTSMKPGTTGHRAALWSEQSGLHELPLPTGFYNSEATAASNSGHVTGVFYDRTFSQHRAFTFANNALTLLPAEQSHPYSINDCDEVVGESLLPGKTGTAPVSWTGNTIRFPGRLLRRCR